MKGWQNQYEIIQKADSDDEYFQKIKQFENYDYPLITNYKEDHIEYKFHQSECFTLGQLIESMNYNFIKIYKGQLLIIILEVLKHLQQLHQQKISHGKLIPQNIIILLKQDKNDKNNNLTIQQTKLKIQKVCFINYSLIDDSNYQINYVQDVNQIIDCFIQIIQAFQKQQCQLLIAICNILNDYKNIKKENILNNLIDFFNLLIQDCVDKEQQKLKKGQISLSKKLNESTIQDIKYSEGEEYGFLSKRNRNNDVIQNFIEDLNQWSINYELNKLDKKNLEDDYKVELFDTSKLNKDELKIFNVIESIIKQQMMKIIWNQIGILLESWEQEFDLKYQAIVKVINQTKNEILNNQLIILIKEFNNVNSITKQIQEEIEKQYKFNIQYDEEKAKDLFILELKIQSQNYNYENFQNFIDTIKSNVKSELQSYYNQIVMIEIIDLQNDFL